MDCLLVTLDHGDKVTMPTVVPDISAAAVNAQHPFDLAVVPFGSAQGRQEVNHPAASCGALSAGRFSLGAAAPKPPLAIPPPSKLGGILAD